tara:strand:- start:4304 stop:5032 length:729 start_codon:yes stop_codon:yes gene_type:complete
MKLLFTLIALCICALSLPAAIVNVPLASTMNSDSFMSETQVTGSISRIRFGDGSANDIDGGYNISNENQLFGGGYNLFPNEANFSIGSLTYDDSLINGTGTEIIGISSIDLNPFGNVDISISAREAWFSGLPSSFLFGAVDENDNLTFNDGSLSSINISLDAEFEMLDSTLNKVSFDGTFIINGADLSLQIQESRDFDTGFFGVVPTTLTVDMKGVVNAIPEPSSALLSLLGSLIILRRRRG